RGADRSVTVTVNPTAAPSPAPPPRPATVTAVTLCAPRTPIPLHNPSTVANPPRDSNNRPRTHDVTRDRAGKNPLTSAIRSVAACENMHTCPPSPTLTTTALA